MQRVQALQDAHVVGRSAELGVLSAFLAPQAALRALVLTGDSGIGKTTLWEVGAELARAGGMRVLSARPSGAEAAVSFAALADLLDDVATRGLVGVPAPQRRALDVALLRAEPTGGAPDLLAISRGFLSALRALAVRQPLLVAVDDVQWLDPPSADALAFAARRLQGHPVRFLLARHSGGSSGLEGAFKPAGLDRLEIGPLDVDATRRLLTERLRLTLPRRVLRRVFETARGNPLFVLELGRTLAEAGAPRIGAEMPLPDLVDGVFGGRVAALGDAARRVLLAVALGPQLRLSQLETLASPVAVEEAVDAGLLIVEGERLRPSHPLLAAAARRRSSAAERRELHLELARGVDDEPLRARHLALATASPDGALAATVAAAAARAAARGAPEDAVELAEHALRLTPPEAGERIERVLALAEFLVMAGELTRLTELLEARIDELPRGAALARAHMLLGESADVAGHARHLERALAECQDEPALRATALAKKVELLTVSSVERVRDAEAWAEDALQAARLAAPEVEGLALYALAWTRILSGRPVDDLLRRFRSEPRHAELYTSVDRLAGIRLAFRGQIDDARAIFRRLLALAEERGEGRSSVVLHLQLCEAELRAGNVNAASRLLDEWDESVIPGAEFARLRCEALIAAIRGRPDEAASRANAALAGSESTGVRWEQLDALRARGIAALVEHQPHAAVEALSAVWEHTRREGVDDPGAFPVAPDLVAALTELGRTDEALAVTQRLRELAEQQEHPWGLASARRCAALVELASGTYDDAAAILVEAADAYDKLGLRFDHARSLLNLGRAARRFRKWAAARRFLEQAAAVFGELDSSGWMEQARSELARVGARRPTPEGALTATEQQVARLAAGGLSNKEIAQALFVSVHTVEVHLSHAYAKLGIRSRAQLASRLASPA